MQFENVTKTKARLKSLALFLFLAFLVSVFCFLQFTISDLIVSFQKKLKFQKVHPQMEF